MKHKNTGFTLIEVLVATVISVSMLTLVMGSFWTLWQTYRTADLLREMQHEATFAMTRIADKVRDRGIDYGAYGQPDKCMNHNDQFCAKGDHFFTYDEIADTLEMGNYTTQEPLFSHDKFAVTLLRFDKFPGTEPTRSSGFLNQFQPQVSIHLQLTSKKDVWGRAADPATALKLNLQTTISSRDYNF